MTNARLDELVALSRAVGRSDRDLVVLAEGNTSTLLDDGTFLVKASGARLEHALREDFVQLRVPELVDACLDDAPRDVHATLEAARVSAGSVLPSIESFMHAVALMVGGARWVVHTHPSPVTGLLASPSAEEHLLAGPLFLDEAVVCGPRPLYVHYASPGIDLGRAVARALQRFTAAEGRAPRVVYLENHGLVALGATADEADAVTTMAVKAARVRLAALAAGGLRPLSPERIARINEDDEIARRAVILPQEAAR
jgi:rhamnose utilization protein RhaD (predicted bifunctional aldolase and dehydrogenase)